MPGAEAAFSSLQTWWAASGSSKAIRNTCIKKIKIKIAIFSLQPPFVPEPKGFSMIPPEVWSVPLGARGPCCPPAGRCSLAMRVSEWDQLCGCFLRGACSAQGHAQALPCCGGLCVERSWHHFCHLIFWNLFPTRKKKKKRKIIK